MSSSGKKLLAGKFQLVVRPIFNGMSLSHHCSQVAVGTQGTRAGNSRHHDIAILRLLLQKLEEEHQSGNIGHLKAHPPHVHQLPPVTSGADIPQILQEANSGREPRPRLLTPIPRTALAPIADRISRLSHVPTRPACPGPFGRSHLSCNLVWRCPYLPSSCNYRAIL